MQDIIEARDRLRDKIEGLDGGYATVAKILKQSPESVLQALEPDNIPRLKTLEKINDAYKAAKKNQDSRLAALND